MKDQDKTQKQLIKEVTRLRQRIAELEASERQRNQFEETLRTERDKAQQYLDIAEVMLVVLDKKGTITLLNRKGSQILGYTEGELIGKNWFATCLPSHLRKNVKGVFQKLMAGEGKQTEFYENPILTKSGTERTIAWHNTVLKDAQGNIIGTLSSGEDITDRKRGEEELQESEEKFSKAFRSSPDTIAITTLKDGRYVDINDNYSRLTGYSREELIGRRTSEIGIWAKTEDRERMLKILKEQGRINNEEFVFRMKSGEVRTWLFSAEPINIGGEPCLMGVSLDITERKQAEEALRESEARFRTLFEGIPDSILVHDDEGNILHINEIGAQRLEWSAKDLVGRNLSEIVTPENAVSIADHIRETHKVGWCRFETTYVSRSGWQIMAEVTERPIKFGEVKAILSVAHDITERKRVEKALRSSRDYLERLTNSMGDAVFSVKMPERVIEWANDSFKLIGYEPGECIGRTTEFLYSDKSEFLDFGNKLKKAMAAGKDILHAEQLLQRKNGEVFPTEITATLFGGKGKIVSVTSIIRDITERKRAEEALREKEEMIRALVETSQDWIWSIDLNGIHTYSNLAVEKILGYTPVELIGKSSLELMHDEDRRTVEANLPQWIKEKSGWRNLILRWRHKAGSWRWLESNAVPIFDAARELIGFRGVDRDITERKQSEEELRTSEAQLSNAMEIAKLGYWEYDVAEDIFTFNDHFYEIFRTTAEKVGGYKMSSEQYAKQFIHPDDISLVGIEIRKAIETTDKNFSRQLDHRIIYADGEIGYISVRFFIVKDSHGRTVKTYGANQDITERKQAEEKLRESESHYRTLFESAGDAIFILDPATGRFIDVNQVACERLGYSREELLQMTPTDIDSPEYAPLVRKRIETLRQRGHLFFETVHVRQDGTSVPTESSSRIIEYDGKPAVLSIARDITERKQAEEALRHSYEQLRETLMTTVSALTSMVEMKDRYTAGHQPRVAQLACAIAEAMGLSEEQIEGIRIAGLVHDIGKINIPAEILSKPGQLTEIQYDMVKMHPQASYDILKGIKFPWPVAQMALQHHERMDGSGYPQGLSGEEILLEARILAVANVVEAMTSHRPYRPAHDIKETLQEISQKKGVFYDPDVVDACLKLFNEKRFTFD